MENASIPPSMLTEKNRVCGALMGLCAGDRNGGPIRMVLIIATSLLQNKGFDRNDVIRRYSNWYLGPPHDREQCFDTGATFEKVFSLHSSSKVDISVISKKLNLLE